MDDSGPPRAIAVQGLSFSYRGAEGLPALRDVDFEVLPGEFVALMGPGGAGKSTMAHALNGLIPHFVRGSVSGEIRVGGQDPRHTPVSHMAREIGLVFQDFEAQIFSTNVDLEVAFGPENFAVPPEEIARRVEGTLRTVGLSGFAGRHPATLSGGQKQRLAIGAVLAAHPRVICMDEPTTDLDPRGKEEVFTIARQLHDSDGLTLVIIEHETEEALHADRLVLMKDGRIVAQGRPADLLRDVGLIEGLGIMPLAIPSYFAGLALGSEDPLPLRHEEGAAFFHRQGLRLDEGRVQELRERDRKRQESYGAVVVRVENLSHTYPQGTRALDGVSLEIRQGEFVALLGYNGSGKTTLAKHFNALLTPTEGRVTVCGKDTRTHSVFEIGQDIGYVFQNPDHQIFSPTVHDEVAFSPRIRGVSPEEVELRVQEALEAVDIPDYGPRDPFSLSKGERQRVAVASVLSARPKIIVLDEPTTGLDYSGQRKMMELIKKLNEAGHTVVIITHTMWVAAEYAHRVVTIKDGRIGHDGPSREVFSREKELAAWGLKTPSIVSLGNLLGAPVLSAEELAYCTKEGR